MGTLLVEHKLKSIGNVVLTPSSNAENSIREVSFLVERFLTEIHQFSHRPINQSLLPKSLIFNLLSFHPVFFGVTENLKVRVALGWMFLSGVRPFNVHVITSHLCISEGFVPKKII